MFVMKRMPIDLYREREWCSVQKRRGCGCRARWAGLGVLALVVGLLLYHHAAVRGGGG